jgi:hypothetical protein
MGAPLGPSFSEHPLLDIRRTVQHREAVRHAGVEKANGFDIHEMHLFQIQSYSWSGTLDLILQLIELLSPKLTAQPDLRSASTRKPFNS